MEALELIQKTSEYLDYIHEHLLNVQKAWKEVQEKCQDMRFIYDDFVYFSLDREVREHDLSKLSENEFIQYRKSFYPTLSEPKYNIGEAWEHHKSNNPHHWENWTAYTGNDPYWQEINCAHMVIDWMAMGYKFGDTAQDYYEKNKDKIKLPEWAVGFIYEIFNRVYSSK